MTEKEEFLSSCFFIKPSLHLLFVRHCGTSSESLKFVLFAVSSVCFVPSLYISPGSDVQKALKFEQTRKMDSPRQPGGPAVPAAHSGPGIQNRGWEVFEDLGSLVCSAEVKVFLEVRNTSWSSFSGACQPKLHLGLALTRRRGVGGCYTVHKQRCEFVNIK